ncbi:MarR family transcriptional regulator [Isobaculum melis]|uniref:MarR family protein n=1 Tax=Isobaculum melis TaxID=142588 RepID=A0A1H9Q2E5_9LACT|nr:MarR family transcriptional regulator [Isobaculum melis]SER54631.1 MarR family protein [Isobaculum melis]
MMNRSSSDLMEETKVKEYYYLYYLSKCFTDLMAEGFEKISERNGITLKAFDVLTILNQKDICTITEISKTGRMHISSALNICKLLEQKGLLELSKSKQDTRVTLATLTNQGIEFINESMKCFYKEDFSITEVLGKIEQQSGIYPSFSDLHLVIYEKYDAYTLESLSQLKK